jgi:GNAT superfamily N-acetyltransferase
MITSSYQIDGKSVAAKPVSSMEETMQAFAVRAACFVGELDIPYSSEFDGQDFGATHLLARLGDEPVGALRLRWFKSFAMPERLSVMKAYRGHGIGRLLLEHSYRLAQDLGCNTLYCRADRPLVGYLERLGWTPHEREGAILKEASVAMTRPANLSQPASLLNTADAQALWDFTRPLQTPLNVSA